MAFLAVCPVAAASPARWFQVRSTHFVVLTDSSEKDARRTAEQFERMHTVFHLIFPTGGDDSDPPITVLAVKDRNDMRALEPEVYLGKGKLDLSGLFLRAPDNNYILLRLDTEEEHPYATVYHEYTHYLLRKADSWLPLWLNEGLAQFYENTDIADKDARLGQPSARDIEYLSSVPAMPLATLLAVDARSPYYHDEDKGSMFYAESWALTHFLIIDDRVHNTHRIHDYAELLVQGEDPVTAGQHAFGDLKKLQLDLTAYLRQPTMRYFTMRADLSPKDAVLVAQQVPQAQVDAIRASVLLYTERTREAQALLGSVLRDDPNNELAHEAMGYLCFKQNDYEGARTWYSQAVALDSHSYLAHYYFAVMTLHSGGRAQDEAVESSLHTSIELNPGFAPSYDALAMFYASRGRSLDQAHLLTLRAVELEPATLGYRIDSAEVLAEQRQFDNAVHVLQAAERLATSQEELERIESYVRRFRNEQALLGP
jgi:tetratricopeptide (TPR) repeat protein